MQTLLLRKQAEHQAEPTQAFEFLRGKDYGFLSSLGIGVLLFTFTLIIIYFTGFGDGRG